MFQRYKQRARRVIFFARYDASRFGSPQIESEHLLLGLVREDEALLSRVLSSGISDESIRTQVLKRAPMGDDVPMTVDLPLSEECKRAMAYAAEEADQAGGAQIGAEHLLLGLLREEGCFAAQMLRERGAETGKIRESLAGGGSAAEAVDPRQNSIFASLLDKTRLAVAGKEPSSKVGFERYTERARRSIFFARYEAGQTGSPTIESGHLLLGALREVGLWYQLFLPAPGSLDAIRGEVERQVARGEAVSAGTNVDLPFAEETKLALTFALEEAERMGQPRMGPEHLLLGLLREKNCLAARLMRARGADAERARRILGEDYGTSA
jgi:ATP-dependent Clp protease ATP-binding subunit ClpA